MGKYRSLGTFLDRIFRNNLNSNFDDIDADIQAQKTRVDTIVASVGNSNTEIVDSRGGFPVLRDRLDSFTSSVAEKAKQTDLNTTNANVANNTVFLDRIANKPYSNIYNTGVGLRKWREALEDMKLNGNKIINVNVMNNSIGEGAGASDWMTTSWLSLVKSNFANRFGDVGFGTIPVFVPFAHHSPIWTFTGTWTTTYNWGFANEFKSCTQDGATATIQFKGTGVSILAVSSNLTGQFGASVDGGTETIFNTALFNDNCKNYDITGLSDGEHTLVIRKIGTVAFFLIGICPLKGIEGIRFNMVGKAGTNIATSTTKTTNAIATETLYAEIDKWAPKLTIIEFFANDLSFTISDYKAKYQIAIDKAKTYGDVLLLPTGIRDNVANPTQPSFIQALRELCLANNIAMIDMYNRWNGDFNYANTTLKYLFDTVHPNDKGHQDIANVVIKELLGY